MPKFLIYRASKSAIYSYTAFLINYRILDIQQGSEYALISEYTISEYTRVLIMSGLHKVLNKIFRDRCLAVFWICLGFWICHGSKYARVAKVVNKTFDHRYWAGFWICLEFWIYQCYTGFNWKQPVIHVWQVSDSPWALSMLGLKWTSIANMPNLHMVLCKVYFKDSQYWIHEFWIC